MKLKQSRLQQIIKEELERIGEEPPRSFDASDEAHKGFDPALDDLRDAFRDVTFGVIDHYKDKPDEYGPLTKEDARGQVKEVLQATLDNFVDQSSLYSDDLEDILDKEFGDDEGELEPPEEESSEEIHF